MTLWATSNRNNGYLKDIAYNGMKQSIAAINQCTFPLLFAYHMHSHISTDWLPLCVVYEGEDSIPQLTSYATSHSKVRTDWQSQFLIPRGEDMSSQLGQEFTYGQVGDCITVKSPFLPIIICRGSRSQRRKNHCEKNV